MTGHLLSPAAVRRRYVALTALRWLPLGISMPVMVLLAAARGLSPAEIGLVAAVHSVVALLLELPTGGLTDAIGHRPVLALSVVLGSAGLLTMAFAQDVAAFALAYGLIGAGRALDSGPLESWFVDATQAADPAADITPGLARGAAANGGGLALGAVLGGLAPLLAHGAGADALAVPFLVAVAVDLVYLAALWALVVPLDADAPAPRAAPSSGFRDAPRIIRETGGLVRGDALLRRLLAVGFLTGLVLSTLELLGPLRFADLAGGSTEGTAVFGVVMALSFGAAAVGSVLAGPARRTAGGSVAVATAVLAVLAAAAVLATALSTSVLPAAAGYAGFYLANAAGWPLRQRLMHSRVAAGQRSTMISVASFALQIGGVAGSLLVSRLAEATSGTVGFAAAAAAMLGTAVLALALRPTATPISGDADQRVTAPSTG